MTFTFFYDTNCLTIEEESLFCFKLYFLVFRYEYFPSNSIVRNQ